MTPWLLGSRRSRLRGNDGIAEFGVAKDLANAGEFDAVFDDVVGCSWFADGLGRGLHLFQACGILQQHFQFVAEC